MIGFDDLDEKIIKLIGKEPAYVSEISKKLGILRTTIQYRLNRLKRADLAEKNKNGVKSIWRPIYKNEHNKNLCQIYKGKNIIQAYKQLLSLPRQTIIFSIQGSDAARSEFEKLPPIFITDAHRIFKRKKIIMRGASNEKALGVFDKLNKTMIRSHIGRPQGLKMFSGEKFTAPGEIMSTEKFLLFANPKKQFAVVIKDEGITKITNDAMRFLFEFLDDEKTFDLNFYLKTKLSRHPQK